MEDSVAVQIVKKPNQENTLKCGESEKSDSEDARYQQHSQHLLSLLPKVVWDHICKFLDSSTFHNLNNSSPFFQEFFFHKRVLLLYKPVFDILLRKDTEIKEETLRHSLFFQRPRKSFALIGRNRLVCKTWRRAIDELASMWKDVPSWKSNATHCFFSENYQFLNYEFKKELSQFVQHFSNTHPSSVNPFVGKFISVTLFDKGFTNFTVASTQVSTLLEKYGHHVHFCEINFGCVDANQPESYQVMLKWLNYMPNLDTLKIQLHFDNRSNNIPNFKGNIMYLEPKCLKKLIIKTLHRSKHEADWGLMEYYNFGQLVGLQEKLQNLHLDIYSKSDIQILKDVKSSTLKTLVANYFCKQEDFNLLEEFTSFADNLSGGLENLKVKFLGKLDSLGHVKIMQDSFHGRLNLQKVRNFGLKFEGSLFCLDFLLGMQDNLEELTLSCVGANSGSYEYSDFSVDEKRSIELIEAEQIIKFLGYQKKMLESNIWSTFPKLKLISLTASGNEVVFSRKLWMENKRLNKL